MIRKIEMNNLGFEVLIVKLEIKAQLESSNG